jgi:TRAP-type C4-dicarboxylate transport system substrate-binding protein
MAYTRREILKGLAAAPAIIGTSHAAHAADARVIKISHQFPGGTVDTGDFRDRLTRKFAAEVEKRTAGSLKFEIYPSSSLMKTVAQFSALRKGALDMTLYPLAYAGGEVQELNIALMPCMVSSYDQGFAWKKAEVGRELTKLLDAKGVKIVTWIWQAGGVASRTNPIVEPADAKGLKIRGGSREMDLMLKDAGGIISSAPSNEIYAAMQTGSLDAAVTSSTSLISFRLEEISKGLTTGRGKSFWFMFEPLLMSKSIYDSLTSAQQKAVADVGLELESFAIASAKADDEAVAAVYKKAGAKVADMDERVIGQWRKIAESGAWPDFSNRSAECDRFLKMAKAVA